jgi:hypothetical protein
MIRRFCLLATVALTLCCLTTPLYAQGGAAPPATADTINPDALPAAAPATQPATAPAVAPAQAVTPYDPSADPTGAVDKLAKALSSGAYLLAFLVAMCLAVWLARLLPIAFLKTDRGGALLALLSGICGTFVVLEVSHVKWSAGVIIGGVVSGATAAGGYAMIKKLFFPSDKAATKA